ncbi:hypothetical protein PENTCL1PPCAC_4741, partial [Pristionchus entomophagus]
IDVKSFESIILDVMLKNQVRRLIFSISAVEAVFERNIQDSGDFFCVAAQLVHTIEFTLENANWLTPSPQFRSEWLKSTQWLEIIAPFNASFHDNLANGDVSLRIVA